MSENIVLNAKPRSETGKGAARRLREDGLIPAVFYGRNRDPQPLTINYREIKAALFSGAGQQSLIQLKVDEATEEYTVMLKDYQIDPIKRMVTHADFVEIDLKRAIQIEVPLELVGEPAGLAQGGILQQIRRELSVSSLPGNLPERIEFDVSAMEIGDSIHVEDVTAPEGVEIIFDTNFTLATLTLPRAAEEEEPEEGEEGLAEEGEEGAEADQEDQE